MRVAAAAVAALASLISASTARAAPGDCLTAPAASTDPETPCRRGPKPNASLVPDLSVFKTPQAPAFAALGVTPSAIERPTTPTGAAVDLVTGFARGVLKPGDNVAWQVSPFWLMSHPELSARDIQNSPWRSIIRDFSISIATAQATVERAELTGAVTRLSTNRVAAGLRTTIFPGWLSTEAEACERLLDHYTLEGADAANAQVAEFVQQWKEKNPMPAEPKTPRPEGPEPTPDPARQAAKADWAKFDSWDADLVQATKFFEQAARANGYSSFHQLTSEVRTCLSVVHHRTGFMWDFAYAMIGDVPNGTTSPTDAGGAIGHALWSTLAYTFSRGRLGDPQHRTPYDFSVLALGRFRYADVYGAFHDEKRVDYGIRLVLARERWGVSVEGLGRYEPALPKMNLLSCSCSLRAGGVVDYRLQSGMWATLSFGSDFKELDGKTPFRLLAHFQANFGLDRLITPDTSTTAPADQPQEATP